MSDPLAHIFVDCIVDIQIIINGTFGRAKFICNVGVISVRRTAFPECGAVCAK